jgi:6-phosphofructokinase 1
MAGIAGGAEAICIPEVETTPEEVSDILLAAYRRGKSHGLVVVAEGAKHNAEKLEKHFQIHREMTGFELRTTKLGHVQRGGAPGAFDRLLGTRLAAGAVDQLAAGNFGVLVGMVRDQVTTTPLEEIAGRHRPVDPSLFELANILAT